MDISEFRELQKNETAKRRLKRARIMVGGIGFTEEGYECYIVAEWLRLKGVLFTHVANEAKCSKQEGAMLKMMGKLAGVSDFLIFTPPPALPSCRGVAIEMKTSTVPTQPQKDFLEGVTAHGWEATTCYSAREAIDYLVSLGF